MSEPLPFKLTGSRATLVHLRTIVPEGEGIQIDGVQDKDLEVHLDITPAFNDQHRDSFAIRFKVRLNIMPHIPLEVEYFSEFKAGRELTDEDRTSHYVRRNAPAIAFPFLRSYVAHITLLAGYDPVILAPVDFTRRQVSDEGT